MIDTLKLLPYYVETQDLASLQYKNDFIPHTSY